MKPEALQNAISGLVAAGAIFRLRERRGWPSGPGSMRFSAPRHQSVARPHKGKESLVSVTQNGFRVINAGRDLARRRRMRDSARSAVNKCRATMYSLSRASQGKKRCTREVGFVAPSPPPFSR